MNADGFRNAIASMLMFDMSDLTRAGVLEYVDMIAYEYYRANPWRWYLNADDDQRERLWKLIERRAKVREEEEAEA
jgi:hypothetical protein